ncbi:MAG: class I SAM-dependent methyltransferase [Proteobacteria bacterium]|nr:class I SAM-dependent methyltransferase [Pseudomonadota bacterium]
MRWIVTAALSIALAGSAVYAAKHKADEPGYIAKALADTGRSDDDRALDTERKPAQMVLFAGIKPGSKVMDLMPGQGYFTRIFAKVVGDKGYVYAYSPTEIDAFIEKRHPGADVTKQFAAYSNVTVLHASVNEIYSPESLDVVWTSQNYHDLHDSFYKPADVAVINKKIFDVLKPGGLYIVLDHAAKPGSGLSATETLHRIDEDAVKKEVEAAGFKFVGESNLLRNPKDPRDKLVFDPSIRHHTDQFILKFMKPRH